MLAGHWPTHIYLSCTCTELHHRFLGSALTSKLSIIGKIPVKEGVAPTASDLGSKSLSDLSVAMSASSTPWTLYDYKDLHISLAKTFSLRHSEIQTFCERLGEAVTAAKTGGIALSFDRWRILVNDAKTTSFASLVASSNVIQILGLIEAVDSVMKRFDHPTYYENPIIHASLAWTPSDTLAQDAATKLFEGVLDPEIPIEGYIKMVYCKVGKVVYSWPLE